MVISAKDIKDKDSLKQWLTEWLTQKELKTETARQLALYLTNRVVLSTLPLAIDWLNSDEASIEKHTTLPTFRQMVLVTGASICPIAAIERFANLYVPNNVVSNWSSYFTIGSFYVEAIDSAAKSSSAEQLQPNVLKAIDASASLPSVSKTDLWGEVQTDIELLTLGGKLEGAALWSKTLPKEVEHAEFEFLEKSKTEGVVWDFWVRFYEMGKAGDAPPWDLLLEIAEIPEKEWEAGPARIAEMIAGIELEWLRKEVSSLNSELSETRRAHATALHRSHNHPPEMVEDDVKAAKAITLVWELLDEAEEELEQETPNPSKLNELSLKLWAALKIIAAYCGKKADKALDKSVEVVGETGTKWAIRVTAGSFAAKQLPLERIAQGLADVAKNLGF